MTSEIYIFSGLGADERVFINLDFSDYKYHFINWIPPLSNESIEGYAKRISNQINTPNPIIIGLSFGGMISIEIAKQMNTHKVILISSAKTSNDIPLLYRIIGAFRIHKIMPYKLFKKSNYLTNAFFGASTKEDKDILKQILIDTEIHFLKWAIDKIVTWKNKTIVNNTIHIHGSADLILPCKANNCNYYIKEGGYLMILNKADEISRILKSIIK